MPGLSSWLSDVSRRKLHVAALGGDGLRDTINLHRFVLLKNSITQAQAELPPQSANSQLSSPVADDNPGHIFVYPDATPSHELLGHIPPSRDSEEKWLESVLETLDDDLDDEVEVDVHKVEEDDDLEFSDLASDPLYDSWSPHDIATHMSNTFLSSPSGLSHPHHTSLQPPFNPLNSSFNQPFIEPRYPEADYDLPTSATSSDSDSDDDSPLTPYSGSQPTMDERGVAEPEVYVEHDTYFLYPSELDPISPQPIYYQQC